MRASAMVGVREMAHGAEVYPDGVAPLIARYGRQCTVCAVPTTSIGYS
jgi:hypothetical protein